MRKLFIIVLFLAVSMAFTAYFLPSGKLSKITTVPEASAIGITNIVSSGSPPGGGPTCSGVWASGQNEAFEKGSAQTCTYDTGTSAWVIATSNGSLNTYSSNYADTGTYGLEASISGASGYGLIEADIGSSDGDCSVRFYLKVPDVDQWAWTTYFEANTSSGSQGAGYLAQLTAEETTGTTQELYIRNGADTSSASSITLTEGTAYRIEVDYNQNGTNELSVYNASTGTELGDSPVTVAESQNSAIQYFYFGALDSGDTSVTLGMDNFKFQAAGGDIGDEP